jgi:hypothetical protein
MPWISEAVSASGTPGSSVALAICAQCQGLRVLGAATHMLVWMAAQDRWWNLASALQMTPPQSPPWDGDSWQQHVEFSRRSQRQQQHS